MKKTDGALLIALLYLTSFFVLSTVSFAGTYEVLSCSEAPNGANRAWTTFSSGVGLKTYAVCPPSTTAAGERLKETGLATTDDANGADALDGSTAGWRLTAPAGTTITRIRYARFLGKLLSMSHQVFLRVAAGTVLESCRYNPVSESGCSVGQPGGTELYDHSGLSTTNLSVGIACIAEPPALGCGSGGALHDAWAVIYGSRVTISDPVAPQLGAVSGSLVDGSSRWRSGTDQVSVTATDSLGIKATKVIVDGGEVSRLDRSCDFTRTVPCTDELGATHTIDWRSTGVSDGSHRVEVVAVDAADNEVKSAPFMVNVDAQPPGRPQNLTTPSVVQDGQNFPVAWLNPREGGTPVVRVDWKACLTANPSTCVTGHKEEGDVQNAMVEVPGRGVWDVAIWLTDEAGNSDPGLAELLVVENRDPRNPGGGGSGGGGPGGGGQPEVKHQTFLSFPSVKRDIKQRSWLLLSGKLTPKELRGSLTINLSFQPKRWQKTLTVQFAGGRWQTRVQLPKWAKKQRSLKGLKLTVSYAGGVVNGQQYLSAKAIRNL